MKKKIRQLFGMMVAIAVFVMAVGAIPAYAAGTQTFYKTGPSGSHVGEFHCYNNNLTPVKTIGESGEFHIFGTAKKGDSLNGNVVTKIEVREYPSGRVLTSTQSYAVSTDGKEHVFNTTPIYLTSGQRIRIYFDVCSIGTPPGGYRSADISYDYMLQ